MSRLGVIAALPAEARCFSDEIFPLQTVIERDNFLLSISGMGSENATSSAQALFKAGATHLASWGTAGALSEECKPGALLVPTAVSCANKVDIKTDKLWREALIAQLPTEVNAIEGTLYQGSNVISAIATKAKLFEQYGAKAVDMESYAIAHFSLEQNIPFIAVRSIVDANTETLPSVALQSVDEFGRSDIRKLIIKLPLHMNQLPKLIRLGHHFNLARKTLIQVSRSSGKSLALK